MNQRPNTDPRARLAQMEANTKLIEFQFRGLETGAKTAREAYKVSADPTKLAEATRLTNERAALETILGDQYQALEEARRAVAALEETEAREATLGRIAVLSVELEEVQGEFDADLLKLHADVRERLDALGKKHVAWGALRREVLELAGALGSPLPTWDNGPALGPAAKALFAALTARGVNVAALTASLGHFPPTLADRPHPMPFKVDDYAYAPFPDRLGAALVALLEPAVNEHVKREVSR